MENKIILKEAYFGEKETEIVSAGNLSASLFTYSTGVKAVRLTTDKGSIIVLPYMGQMVWRAEFLGYEMTMKTIFDEPIPAKDVFHETYGGFVMHCGLTAMGNPTAEDDHKPHGELPICKYDSAYILVGEDEGGRYIGISGTYSHKSCYAYNYDFTPVIKMYEGKTYLDISVSFVNNKDVPLEYYYLCHINHRPVNGATLSYTADRKKIKVNHEVPDDYFCKSDADATNKYLDMLDKDPSIMDKIGEPYQAYRPEIVFYAQYEADECGNAYTMQVNPDGYATYVVHKPAELPYGIRWISRTDDEDTMGMVLPSTAEHLGKLYCQKNGQSSFLNKGDKVSYHIQTGYLVPAEAAVMQDKIKKMGF
jgi:hypothetical protein